MRRRAAEAEPTRSAIEPEGVAGESEEGSDRGVRVAAVVVALVIVWRLVVVFPYVAYVIVGVLVCLGWQRAGGWLARRRTPAAEEEQAAEQPDVGAALRRLVGDDNGVLLTRLRDDLKLPDTKVVKRLLDDAGVSWKAVRTPRGNGPGVHVKDIPAAPSPASADAHGDGCCCRSGDNANSDNADGEGPREGVRVDRTLGFTRLFDPGDAARFHKISKP
ncbi:hypothetical protein [Streptomyces sp. NBC_01171]|uniref:hypothetical protein n=1 Tax=Streptomyces sp. NBC_01171 TaxID=2903757 RepID=UPI003868206A|nr:hypothetical protein OG448_15165 [Streptomyces sp. NBC_01171]